MNLENELHAACVIENNELQALVKCDYYRAVKNMVEQLSVHYLSLASLHALGKGKKLDKWVLHELT